MLTINLLIVSGTVANDSMVIDTQSDSGDIIDLDKNDTFYSFQKLPLSVRNKIWAFNLPGPRLVEVIFRENESEEGWYTNAPIISNLSVCRESRLEALKTHPLLFACFASPAMIPFNFATDTLFLGRKMLGTEASFKKHRVGNDLAKVQFLMVDASLEWGKRTRYDRGIGNLGRLSQLVFSGVKEHTVLYTGTVDPLPGWAMEDWFPCIVWPRWRNADAAQVVARFKRNWPLTLGRHQLPAADANKWRYGGIPESEKYDPAIGFWYVSLQTILLGIFFSMVQLSQLLLRQRESLRFKGRLLTPEYPQACPESLLVGRDEGGHSWFRIFDRMQLGPDIDGSGRRRYFQLKMAAKLEE
jgi:hypothetical protein